MLYLRILPQPKYAPAISDDEDDIISTQAQFEQVTVTHSIPPYGQRRGWRPTKPSDFGIALFIVLNFILIYDFYR